MTVGPGAVTDTSGDPSPRLVAAIQELAGQFLQLMVTIDDDWDAALLAVAVLPTPEGVAAKVSLWVREGAQVWAGPVPGFLPYEALLAAREAADWDQVTIVATMREGRGGAHVSINGQLAGPRGAALIDDPAFAGQLLAG